jgi:transposase
MAGKSPVTDQRAALKAMAGGADRAEADRARAIVLTLGSWTSARIAEAFGVREDTVRLWRSDFMSGGVDALKASVAPGPAPVKAAAALKVAEPLLSAPVANRTNWTLARLAEEITSREGVTISRSQLSRCLIPRFDGALF